MKARYEDRASDTRKEMNIEYQYQVKLIFGNISYIAYTEKPLLESIMKDIFL